MPVIDRIEDTVNEMSLDDLRESKDGVYIIEVSEGKYAANHATTPPPDPMQINGIACFETVASANEYMGALNGLSGTLRQKSLEEVRKIVEDKPMLQAIFFFVGSHIVGIHYVR
jgi:hypothetical protein